MRKAAHNEFDPPSYEQYVPYINVPMPDELDMRKVMQDEFKKVDKEALEKYQKQREELHQEMGIGE